MPADTLLDDFILSLRIAAKGYKIAYCKEAYATETASLNMKEEEKRKIRIAAGGLQSVWRLKGLFNIFRYGTLSFQYVSHRVLRWTLTPLMLFLLLPANFVLALSGSPFYIGIFVLQLLFTLPPMLVTKWNSGTCVINCIYPLLFYFYEYKCYSGILLPAQKQGKWSLEQG